MKTCVYFSKFGPDVIEGVRKELPDFEIVMAYDLYMDIFPDSKTHINTYEGINVFRDGHIDSHFKILVSGEFVAAPKARHILKDRTRATLEALFAASTPCVHGLRLSPMGTE